MIIVVLILCGYSYTIKPTILCTSAWYIVVNYTQSGTPRGGGQLGKFALGLSRRRWSAPQVVRPDQTRRHQWSPRTMYGCHSWSPHRTWTFYAQYCYDSRTVSIWLDIATTVFQELNGKTGTLSRDITAVISTIPAMSAVVSGHNIIR